MNILDLPLHERPREKLMIYGVQHLKDAELLAIMLRTGLEGKSAIELAKAMLLRYKMETLMQLSFEDLIKIKGIGKDKACMLLSAFELTKRALAINETSLPLICTPKDIVDQLTDIRSHKKEHFVILCLNARNQLIHRETISIGTVNTSIVHPREVFEPAIRCSASHIILAHNHPSGETEPSDPDVAITERLVEAGQIIGIEIIDHVIVTKKEFVSFKQRGQLQS